jgi:guanylate kinase
LRKGKLIFISGLTGAGKTTLVGEALKVIDNLEFLLTYTTRPKREEEDDSFEYVFLNTKEYESKKALSNKWDETIYKGYKYGSNAEKFINDLQQGINVIVSVTPNMDDIRAMAQIYEADPITIWINTDRAIAASRVREDKIRSLRKEGDGVKMEFNILFEPTNDIQIDTERFVALINKVIAGP